jgi:polyphosphate glucokinase
MAAKAKARAAKGEKPKATPAAKGARTLCIDVGGTGLKAIVLDEVGTHLCERVRIPTPRPATPAAVLAGLRSMLLDLPEFDRVSVGFPGVVKNHVIRTAPNLDGEWAGVALGAELEKMTGKPARVLNDAGVQGFGAITGKGVEQMLTLGTGMGHALFVDGRYVPNVELAHHPLHGKKKTYEDFVSDKALSRVGKRKWNKRVREVLETVQPIFNPDVIYIGGGNARLLKGELPGNVRVIDNLAGLLGGIALWRST